MKCAYCKEEHENADIHNYVVKYESWEAFNCCSKECAKQEALRNGIEEDEIIDIEGGW